MPSLRRPVLGLVVAVVVAVALSGCAKNAPQDSLKPAGSVARQLNNLFVPVFWVAVVVFVIVGGLVTYCVFRFRARDEDEAPKQIHGHTRLEITWTIIPAVMLAVIAVPTVKTVFDINRMPKNAMQIDVTGHRWWWEYDYRDAADPTKILFATANEMHIPTGQKVELNLGSVDVIHNFWPPELAGKVYAIPGRRNHMVVEADHPGTFYGQCAEYCGTSHGNMRLRVIADTPQDFQTWLSAQGAPANQSSGAQAAAGQQLFSQKGCSGCHAINGISDGIVGPNLTHFKSRSVFAGSIFQNTDPNLRAWLTNPPAQKPGALMPNLGLSQDEMTKLIAYLDTLR
jgi:cytochrome c oxidase subunit 2